jgi:glutathione synthase/RimK-type ligase-like ATP-grasp enzyme
VPAPRVALLTAATSRHLDEDLPLLTSALGAVGVAGESVDWHDDAIEWGDFDLAVLRSTWDYTSRLDAFLHRLEVVDAATALANPLDVVRANADKRYLVELAAAGVPVVPTVVVSPGDDVALPAGTFVVKPTVSAGARDTERYGPAEHEAARAQVDGLLDAGRPVLLQPYVEGIDAAGETGMVFVGDRFSHAFRKGPILRPDSSFVEGLYREEDISGRDPSPAEREVAEAVLDAVGAVAPGRDRSSLLYARVDLAPGPDGPLLLELELIEPSLFLTTSAGAADRAAAAILARL